MRNHEGQSGFTIIELVLVVVALALVGFGGWKVYDTHHNAIPAQSPTASVPSAPAVSSATDLNSAQTALDQNDPSNSNTTDLSQLDSQLNSF